jgi:mRNA interferase RelE/StbE
LSDKYKIFETEEFIAKLESFGRKEKAFLYKKLTGYVYPQLRNQPHYGNNIKKLVNYKPETWRYRIGKYRVFYILDEDEKIISLLTIDLRRDAY